MDLTPRNQYNCRLSSRYWDIPTDIPKATHFNTPIGTRYCDKLGYLCHPQQYKTFHQPGNYPDTQRESKLYNLDYYNPIDYGCSNTETQKLSPELIGQHFNNNIQNSCITTPRLWNNTTKLWKFDQTGGGSGDPRFNQPFYPDY